MNTTASRRIFKLDVPVSVECIIGEIAVEQGCVGPIGLSAERCMVERRTRRADQHVMKCNAHVAGGCHERRFSPIMLRVPIGFIGESAVDKAGVGHH